MNKPATWQGIEERGVGGDAALYGRTFKTFNRDKKWSDFVFMSLLGFVTGFTCSTTTYSVPNLLHSVKITDLKNSVLREGRRSVNMERGNGFLLLLPLHVCLYQMCHGSGSKAFIHGVDLTEEVSVWTVDSDKKGGALNMVI